MKRTDYFKLISKKIVEAKLSHVKTVIPLRARNNAGKTSTIKQLCRNLFDANPNSWKGPRHYHPAVVDYTRGEIRCIFEIEGVHIAIFSEGDTAKAMYEVFEYCMRHEEIDIVVLAVRSSQDGNEFNAEIAYSEIKKVLKSQEELAVWMKEFEGDERVAEEIKRCQELEKTIRMSVIRLKSKRRTTKG